MAEVGSLSASAKMTKTFVRRVFAIFAANELFLPPQKTPFLLKVDLSNKTRLLLLISEANKEREIARMASLGLPHAGNWLSVVPSPALGLHLRPSEFIPAIKYRLGIPVYSSEGPCPACAAQSDRMGDHALGCVSTSDRIARHNMLRDVIYETGFHSGALAQVKLLGSALARSKGLDENEVTSQFFGRLSLCLMRGNAVMLSSRSPDQDIPVPEIDGVL